jgi:hypothetical protein
MRSASRVQKASDNLCGYRLHVALCHHHFKQHPAWTLTQPRPGTMHWTTPTGRAYTTHPRQHYTG